MNSCREKNLQLTRMTVAVAMMMIMSTILCLKKKKEKKKTKKKNFNKLQKAFQSNKKKEKVKKDTLEIESKEKEKLLTSNQPAETINNKQFGGVDIYGDQFGPFHGSDEKEAFYPSVAEPTASTKRKREEELEKDKEEKIKQGFYQVNYF
ncbi:unnamed protein product [Onchocerca flexuosa]|uniref:Uncharacterized protein n=1 Tax=Onchocerca flexuosa TaxID=387005 RepID=A0A183I5X5_9BILA|nr:unnamed protein product [Onchocerca flexuosa]